jgi:hypothetical protein
LPRKPDTAPLARPSRFVSGDLLACRSAGFQSRVHSPRTPDHIDLVARYRRLLSLPGRLDELRQLTAGYRQVS